MCFHFLSSCCAVTLAVALVGCDRSDSGNPNVASEETARQEPVATNPPVTASTIDTDALIGQVEGLLNEEKFEQANRLLQQVLVAQPDHTSALFLMSQLQAATGKLTLGIETLDSIPSSDPDFGLAAIGQSAQWLSELGRVEEARDKYARAISLAPELPFLKHEFAEFLNSVGWRYQANELLMELAQEGQATEVELRAMLDVSNSYGAAQVFAQRQGLREGPLSTAMGAMSKRQPRTAIRTLTSMLKSGFLVNDPAVQATMAAAYVDLQDFDAALKLLANASPEIQSHPFFWLAIGELKLQENKIAEAIGALLRAVELDSTNQRACERLMSALLRIDASKEARAVDDLRASAITNPQTSRAVGVDQPEDLQAAIQLSMDLEQVGQSAQAANWLILARDRQSNSDVKNDLTERINRLLKVDPEVDQNRRRAGIDPAKFPTPSLDSMLLAFRTTNSQPPSMDSETKVSNRSPATFVDVAESMDLRHEYLNAPIKKLKQFNIYQEFGAGVAAIDYDHDGRIDLYCGQGGGDPPLGLSVLSNTLHRNLGSQFVEISTESECTDYNYTAGVTAGDVNQDGWPDLVVGNLGLNRLLINQGDGTFLDASQSVGWTDPEHSHYTMGLAVADVDGDRIADIVEVNYVNDPTMYEPLTIAPDGELLYMPVPLQYRAEVDRVWMTQPIGQLTPLSLGSQDASTENNGLAVLGSAASTGLVLLVSNLDSEPGLEIFVGNDSRPNQLWKRSTESNVFDDVAISRGCAFSSRGESTACMGIAFADFNQDSVSDMIITNWYDEWLNLYLFDQAGLCRDLAPKFGLDKLSESLLGFGTQPIDYNNNGLVDVVILNGHVEQMPRSQVPFAMPAQLLENLGGRFELAVQTDESFWGRPHVGRCAITCDFNRDGRIDVVAADLLEPMALLENQTQTNHHWLQVSLIGVESERDAIGAQVTVVNGEARMTSTTASGDGYQGRNETLVHFGLGDNKAPIDLEVSWPSGKRSRFQGVPVDQRYLIVENDEMPWPASGL